MKKILLLFISMGSFVFCATDPLEKAVNAIDVEEVERILEEQPEKLSNYHAVRLAHKLSSKMQRSGRGKWIGGLLGLVIGAAAPSFLAENPPSYLMQSSILGVVAGFGLGAYISHVPHEDANRIMGLLTKNLSQEVIAGLPMFTSNSRVRMNVGPFRFDLPL